MTKPCASTKNLAEIYEWYGSLVRADRNKDWIPALQNKARSAHNKRTLFVIESLLVSEYQRQQRYQEAMTIIDRQISENPNDPVPQIEKASQLLHYEQEYQLALTEMDAAISKAKLAKRFYFQACGVRARIGAKLDRPDIVRQTMLEMMKWDPNDTIVDIPPETDFLRKVPEGTIVKELTERYLDFCRYVRESWDTKFPAS